MVRAMPRAKLLAATLIAAGLLALPAAARATLAYVRNPAKPVVYVANDNGGGARKVGLGNGPRVSPDGQLVVYLRELRSGVTELLAAPAGGGASRVLMSNCQEGFRLAFSPDSALVAALRGPFNGPHKLVVIDIASGYQRVVASGYFSGFSFSPDSSELVYARAGSESYPPRSDIYRVSASGGKPVRLTRNHRSESPLWGPTGQIVFVKLLGAKTRKYGPKNELYLMSPEGGQVKRLTHTKVAPLLQGLTPTEWSANGARLLAEFEGEDTTYAVAVNPQTGAEHALTRQREANGFIGAALSADGSVVLGVTGGFEPSPRHNIATVPYVGGRVKVLVKNAYEPDWSR
jgi:Tol biopolymer transport system component